MARAFVASASALNNAAICDHPAFSTQVKRTVIMSGLRGCPARASQRRWGRPPGSEGTSERKSAVAAAAPRNWATMKPGPGGCRLNVSVSDRAT
jgi:hypothetical protein